MLFAFCLPAEDDKRISGGGENNSARAEVDGKKPDVSSSTEDVFFTKWERTTYRLSAAAVNGWEFIDKETVITAGDPDGNSATKTIKATETSPEWFSLGLRGKMFKPGDEEGSPIGWSAKIDTRFFYIKSDRGTRDAVVAVGSDIEYSARDGERSAEADWNIESGSGSVKKTNSDYFQFSSDIGNQAWMVPGTRVVDGGEYTVKATSSSGQTDSGTLKVVGPDAIKISEGYFRQNSDYGKSAADQRSKIFLWGDDPISSRNARIEVTVATTPSVAYDEIPSGWTGIEVTDGIRSKLSSFYSRDTAQPKLKGTIVPNVMGCIGYVSAGGNTSLTQKYLKFVKFGVWITPTDDYDLYVFKEERGFDSAKLEAKVNPEELENIIDADKSFEWEITKGGDKVELTFDKNDKKKKYCTVKARGIGNLSRAVGDVEVKVRWSYGSVAAADTTKFTVRSIWFLEQISSRRIVDDIQKPSWIVVYKLKDNLGQFMPDNVCAGLKITESFISNVWEGAPELGDANLKRNYAADTFRPMALQSWSDGKGTQVLTVDHIRLTHDISIPWDGDKVEYSNVVYQRNQ